MTDIRGITIRTEEPKDYRTTENLTREAFWNVYRPGCMEHYVLHCFRSDPAFVPELDFVMELHGEMIGQVIYVRSEIDCDDGSRLPIMTFGPIGIAPAYKRQGYGKILLDYSMEKARAMGVGALAITGNIGLLRQIRLCSSQNQRRPVRGRSGSDVFSDPGAEGRLSERRFRLL